MCILQDLVNRSLKNNQDISAEFPIKGSSQLTEANNQDISAELPIKGSSQVAEASPFFGFYL